MIPLDLIKIQRTSLQRMIPTRMKIPLKKLQRKLLAIVVAKICLK